MQQLTGAIRSYPWGSRSLISGLRGLPVPSASPEAELWFGAHPTSPALIDGRPLTEVIAEDPLAALGPRVSERFGEGLPFLVKLLAAAEPLSLQAHPSQAQAQEGFQRENEENLPLEAGNRNYRDPHHKPEVIVALTDFSAMAGFRPLHRTREIFEALDCSGLDRYLAFVQHDPGAGPSQEEDNLRALFTTWITIPAVTRTRLIEDIVESARPLLDGDDWIAGVLRTVTDLQDRYPGDVGVLGALLLNHLQLAPGEAIYLDAGQLHAYISGLGVEVMANSDNVLRGGLTSKYVDVPELVKVLDFRALAEPVFTSADGRYPVPVEEFDLTRHEITDGVSGAGDGALVLDHDGPSIALCTAGELVLGELTLTPGRAVWIPASDPAIPVRGTGQLFVACA